MPKLDPIQISVVNASTVLSDSEIEPVIAALQKQVTNDFRPAWGVDAELSFVALGEQPSADTWWLTILDDADQAGALGYHDLTPAGLPMGKVFAGTDLKYGYTWSVTASHELLEMLADPNINLTVLVQSSDTAGKLYAYEVCDTCEADENGYEIDGVLLSDFVFPSWFEDFRTEGSTQFDQTNKHRAKVVFDAFYWIINLGSLFASALMPSFLRYLGPAFAFGIPGALMFISTVILWLGRKRYVMVPPSPPNPHSFLRVCRDAITSGARGRILAIVGALATIIAFLLISS